MAGHHSKTSTEKLLKLRRKWPTYEIWSESGEASMFIPANCTKEQYHLMTHTVYGKPMILRKRFQSPTWESAKKVYDKLLGH